MRYLLAVKPAVLDKDLVGARSGHNHPRQVDARHIAFQGLWIADGKTIGAFEAHSHALQKGEIKPIAGHGEDEVVRQNLAPRRCFDNHRIGGDFNDIRVEKRLDFSVLDAIFDVRLDPVLYMRLNPPARGAPA